MAEKVIASKICPEKLQNLWQEKEYRNLPSVVMSYVNRDTSVSADARICWYELFNIAYFNKSWCVQISKSVLGERINRSESSIERYLDKLKEAGYVDIENVRVRGAWLPSKITVTVPPALLQLLEAAPERKKISKPLELVVDNTANSSSNMFHVEPESCKNKAVEPQPPYPQMWGEGIPRSEGSKSNINHNKLYTNNNNDIARSTKENKHSVVVNSDEAKKPASRPIQLKQHPVIKLDNSAVLANRQRIQDLEHELNPLREQLKALSFADKAKFYNAHMLLLDKELHELMHFVETMVLADVQCRFDAGLVAKAEFRRQQLKTLEIELSLLKLVESELHCGQMQDEKTKDEMVSIERNRLRVRDVELEIMRLSDIDRKAEGVKRNDYLHSKGQREFSDIQSSWLKAQIAGIDNTADKERVFEIANQIAYQVRFGNLQVSYKTRQVMSVQHGLNVALKTFRAGGWTKPSGMLRAA